MTLDLTGKRILLIAPRFFGYETDIKIKLEKLGAVVDYVDMRPANSFLTKALIRLDKRFLKGSIYKYYKDILMRFKQNDYDFVLILNLEGIFPDILKSFRECFGSAKFILYMWDSFDNKRQTKETIPYFDKVFSFDRNDSNADKRIKFRPLFFVDEFDRNLFGRSAKEFDLSFIGTVHSDRYRVIKAIKEKAVKEGLKVHFYMFIQHPILFFYRKLLDRSFRKATIEEFNFKALSKRSVADIIFKSKAVLDINHPKQVGLTMRTFEVLGAKAKLITTNEEIINYNFYNVNNICLFNRESLELSRDFVEGDMVELSDELRYEYSIEGWLNELLR